MLVRALSIGAGVLAALLGVQTSRLSHARLDLAKAETAQAQFLADIATQREAGVRDGVARQKAAQDELEARNREIIAGLKAANAKIQRSYDNTYAMLRESAATPRYSCYNEPMTEQMLQEFRR